MKKGFTLIELLAVLLLLVTIVLLATPSVTKLINNSRKLTKDAIEDKLIDAAKEYTSSYNKTFLNDLINVGDNKTISSNILIEYDLIEQKEIDLLEEDTVFVKITLQENNKLQYTVQYE